MTPQGLGTVPPDGFTFTEAGTTLTADNEEDLVKALEGYRVANGRPIGNPGQDVHAALVARSSQQRSPDPYLAPKEIELTLRDRVTNWLRERFSGAVSGALQLVPDPEAERRAGICASCPSNVAWRTGCPACVANNDRVITMLVQGKFTKFREKLQGCSSHGWDNNAATRLDKNHLGKPNTDAPSVCWMHESK